MLNVKPLLLSASIIYVCSTFTASSQTREITTDDGREVILNEDGTWEFKSNDIFANTSDGFRIRLKEDGSWEYVGNTPISTPEKVRTPLLALKLNKVVEEQVEKKVHKNVRVKSQMVFYISAENSPLAKRGISIQSESLAHIQVMDDTGKDYPVLSLNPESLLIEPSNKAAFKVRANGAPDLLSKAKSMRIVFKSEVFNTDEAIELTYKLSEFEEKKVSNFD